MTDTVTDRHVETLWKGGVHIMGSRTFYDMASYWPYSTESIAAPMNEIPKVVFTKKGLIESFNEDFTPTAFKEASGLRPIYEAKTLSKGAESWTSVGVATGDLHDEIHKLKQESGKDIIAHGGVNFAQSLVGSGLIDEYALLVHPVVLGKGLSIFSTIDIVTELELGTSTKFDSGAIVNIYRPA